MSDLKTSDLQTPDLQTYDPRQHLIVALDVSSAAAARKIVAAVGDSALTYKVGMQLYTAEGPSVVRDLVASGRRVFLDQFCAVHAGHLAAHSSLSAWRAGDPYRLRVSWRRERSPS